ncbi:cytochrome c biogenesis CcdA family protein [Mycobacterium sp. NPDC048908]|uniref:cytochrome c biogenesis CcdA family protein n=1 Tax=Mycobacterium sp. NPDC048908 TaxID=3364292 RepID=UPI0037185CCC
MDQDLVGLAFGAGLVAALNPCGFAMLPAYLALVVRGGAGDGDARRRAAVMRAATASAAMTLGFVAVFGGFGLLTVSVASTVQRYLPYVTAVIGVGLVAVGIWLLTGREISPVRLLARGAQWAPTARLGSMFGYGISYAIASLSCTVGPFLAVTAAGLRSSSAVGAATVYLAYVGGFALVVGVLAMGAALATSAVADRMRRIVPHVNRISGALLVVVGGYVGYYGFYEIRLFSGNGSAEDPVIAAAGRVQGAVAGWVHQHGAWPWLVAMAVLVAAATSLRVRYRRADRARAADGP